MPPGRDYANKLADKEVTAAEILGLRENRARAEYSDEPERKQTCGDHEYQPRLRADVPPVADIRGGRCHLLAERELPEPLAALRVVPEHVVARASG